MKIYDISQEVFSCEVYPGDDCPVRTPVELTDDGGICNVTNFSMCAHNGTHVDAPYHFISGGKTVDRLDMDKLIGYCYVGECSGTLTADGARNLIESARKVSGEHAKRILIKGGGTVSKEAGEVFISSGVSLIGVEVQSVSEASSTREVHTLLLSAETVLLEGIRLGEVSEGGYFLFSAPINLGGSDGAPCRAVLVGE